MLLFLPHDALLLERFLPYRLNVLSHRLAKTLARRYERRFGITIPDWRCLAILARQGGLTAGELAERTSLERVQISRATARLVGRELVARRIDPSDRRVIRLELTDAGRTLFGDIAEVARAWEQELTQALGLSERRTLERVLDKLERTLDRASELDEDVS